MQLLVDLDFTTPAFTGEYLISFGANPSGSFSSSSQTAIVLHIQQTTGSTYYINQTVGFGGVTHNTNSFAFQTGSSSGANFTRTRFISLVGSRRTFIKIYGFQKNVTGNQDWDSVHVSCQALTKGV